MSKERKKHVCLWQRFIAGVLKVYGEPTVSTDDDRTWYLPPSMSILKIDIVYILPLGKAS
jgi:hypothetical protein